MTNKKYFAQNFVIRLPKHKAIYYSQPAPPVEMRASRHLSQYEIGAESVTKCTFVAENVAKATFSDSIWSKCRLYKFFNSVKMIKRQNGW